MSVIGSLMVLGVPEEIQADIHSRQPIQSIWISGSSIRRVGVEKAHILSISSPQTTGPIILWREVV